MELGQHRPSLRAQWAAMQLERLTTNARRRIVWHAWGELVTRCSCEQRSPACRQCDRQKNVS